MFVALVIHTVWIEIKRQVSVARKRSIFLTFELFIERVELKNAITRELSVERRTLQLF